jgi:hypothetical protein
MGGFLEGPSHKEFADQHVEKPEAKQTEQSNKKEISDSDRKAKIEANEKRIAELEAKLKAEALKPVPKKPKTELPKVETHGKTLNSDRLSIKYRGKVGIDGKPSAIPYESPKESNCNLVAFVAFGKANKITQKKLNERLNQAEIVLSDIGIKFKNPMDFVCQNLSSSKNTQAQYVPMKTDNPRINIVALDSGITKSLMHEIGHALDYSMETKNGSGRMSELLSNKSEASPELKSLYSELNSVVKNSTYYQQADYKRAQYLNKPTEVFARAFEVYCFAKGKKLVKSKKLSNEYLEGFKPDVFKTKNEKLEELVSSDKELTGEYSKTYSLVSAKKRDLYNQAKLNLKLTPEDLRFDAPKISDNYAAIEQKSEELQKTDPEYLKLQANADQIEEQLKSIRKQRNAIVESGNAEILIDPDKQAEYESKIVKIMDLILKNDEVRKSMEVNELINLLQPEESLEKDAPFIGYSKEKNSKDGGLNDKYREKYNREHGSHLQRPVTGEVKQGSKAAKRRKSFCARMSGVTGPTSKDGKLTPKGAALKRWKC